MTKEKTKTNRWIVFRIIGVLVVIVLIAAAAFAAYRFGWQKGRMIGAEAPLVETESWNYPWQAMPLHRFFWLPFGGIFGLTAGFFLVLMAVRFIIGPRHMMTMPHHGRFHPRWRRFDCNDLYRHWRETPPEDAADTAEPEN